MQSSKILSLEVIKTLHLKHNIFISLTTIPPRFLSDNFDKIINSLKNQTLKCQIIINIPKNYKRKFDYSRKEFENKIEKIKKEGIIVNIIDEDYGPITKIIGIMNLKFNDKDIIISLDDDFEIHKSMSYFHVLCYKIYKCDCIFVPETLRGHEKDIFTDNYSGSCFGYYTFSFRFKFVKELYNFYLENLNFNENLWRHDDLIISVFYKVYQLNACCININFRTKELSHRTFGLHTISGELQMREKLHKNFYTHYSSEILKKKSLALENKLFSFNNSTNIILNYKNNLNVCNFFLKNDDKS